MKMSIVLPGPTPPSVSAIAFPEEGMEAFWTPAPDSSTPRQALRRGDDAAMNSLSVIPANAGAQLGCW